jgi:DNA adenine methylase
MQVEMKLDAPKKKTHSRYKIPRPFVKWVGGKTQILGELKESIRGFDGCYLEPFLGGGALFFELGFSRAVISDTNRELVNCYVVVRDHVEELIGILKEHIYDKEYYYKVRAHDPDSLDSISRAARMIYLNKAGYNGLYRVNNKGKFNVPFGRYKNPTICDEDNLRGCAVALRNIDVACATFDSVLDTAKKEDFVYFDPPYIPISETAYFTSYQKNGFSEDDQKRLVEVFDELSRRRIPAMLSNSDVPWIHEHYRKHNIRVIKARRVINSKANRRGFVGEVIVTNY